MSLDNTKVTDTTTLTTGRSRGLTLFITGRRVALPAAEPVSLDIGRGELKPQTGWRMEGHPRVGAARWETESAGGTVHVCF